MGQMKMKRDRIDKYLENIKSFPTSAKAASIVIDVPLCVLPALLLNTNYLTVNGVIYNESGMNAVLLKKRQIESMSDVCVGELMEAAGRGYIFEVFNGRITDVLHTDATTKEAEAWTETA